MAIYQHDRIVLITTLPQLELHHGDIGTVVHCWRGGAYEVEFITTTGELSIVATIERDELRPLVSSDVPTDRPLLHRSRERNSSARIPCVTNSQCHPETP